MKEQEKQIFDKYGNYDFPTDVKQEGLNNATSQIEEMSETIQSYSDIEQAYYDGEWHSVDVYRGLARTLYSKDFRIVNKDSVVLSREEYEKVKYVLKYEPEEAIIRLEDLTKNERLYSPHMFCSLGGCSGVSKGCNRTCKESWIVMERKETAEKIIDLIKAFCPDKKFVETITHIILERFGFEIKE